MINRQNSIFIYPYKAFKLAQQISKGPHYEKVCTTLKKAILQCELEQTKENDELYTLIKLFYLLLMCEIQRKRLISSYIDYRLQVRVISEEYNSENFYKNYLEIVNFFESKLKADDYGNISFDQDFKEDQQINNTLLSRLVNVDNFFGAHELDDDDFAFIDEYNLKDIFIIHFGKNWVEDNFTNLETKASISWKKIFKVDSDKNIMTAFLPTKYAYYAKFCEERLERYESGLENFYYINNYIPIRKKSLFSDEEYSFTKQIHNFKYQNAIDYYYKILNELISDDCIISSVPSHKKENITAVDILVYELCKNNNRINASSVKNQINGKHNSCFQQPFLLRTKTIPKKSDGFRDFDIEEATIKVNQSQEKNIENKHILLLDDITTTSLSFTVSQKKLLDYGAKRVICLALGKTVYLRDLRFTKYSTQI